MEDLDEKYKDEIQNLDNFYLESLKKGANKKELQKQYLEKLRKIRENYFKLLNKNLSNEKKTVKKDNPINFKEKFKPFKSEKLNINKNFFEKTSVSLSIFSFKIKRKVRSFFMFIFPIKIRYFFYSLRISFVLFLKKSFFSLKKIKEKISYFFKSFFSFKLKENNSANLFKQQNVQSIS